MQSNQNVKHISPVFWAKVTLLTSPQNIVVQLWTCINKIFFRWVKIN
jgi:hypothetical protein